MVQLPATAATEYVAACCGTRELERERERKRKLERKLKLQESCAIAKMTAQCALYVGTLKNFGTPDYDHGYYSQHFHGLLFGSTR